MHLRTMENGTRPTLLLDPSFLLSCRSSTSSTSSTPPSYSPLDQSASKTSSGESWGMSMCPTAPPSIFIKARGISMAKAIVAMRRRDVLLGNVRNRTTSPTLIATNSGYRSAIRCSTTKPCWLNFRLVGHWRVYGIARQRQLNRLLTGRDSAAPSNQW